VEVGLSGFARTDHKGDSRSYATCPEPARLHEDPQAARRTGHLHRWNKPTARAVGGVGHTEACRPKTKPLAQNFTVKPY
jgi:hypothetical protein